MALAAETAVFGALAGLAVEDGAGMDAVLLEMLAQQVGAGHKIEHFGVWGQGQGVGFGLAQEFARDHTLGQLQGFGLCHGVQI